MKFSICIPNYNYAKYIGRTITSVVEQSHRDLEVLVSDNCSTDESLDIVRAIGDARIRLHVNACNVGFARNLDRAAADATGDLVIMLSSDDLVRPRALETYDLLYRALGDDATSTVTSSSWDVIDGDDRKIGETGPSPQLFLPSDRDARLEALVGAPVYRTTAETLLQRSLRRMANPFNFAATVYPRELYRAVEGYGGGRLINPDKWFHLRLLGVAKHAIFIDEKLFAYRWHASNQTAAQMATGALKYLVDEYATTLELEDQLLQKAALKRADVVHAFVEHDIARHGLATLAKGQRARAARILDFGKSVYPAEVRANWKSWALKALLHTGPLGSRFARIAYERRDRLVSDAARQ